VLDEMGADKLLGNGDLLFLWPGTSTLIRGQGTYLSDDEINQVIDAVATTEPQYVKELVQLKAATPDGKGGLAMSDRDELYEAAVDVVVREGRGSVSLLQRSLGIGYGRAARLIDYMAEDGFVGPYNGSQAREVTISLADWEAMTGGQDAATAAPSPAPKRTNKIRMEPAPRRTPPPRAVSEFEDEVEDDDDQEDEDEEEDCEEDYDEEDCYDDEDEPDEQDEDAEDPPFDVDEDTIEERYEDEVA